MPSASGGPPGETVYMRASAGGVVDPRRVVRVLGVAGVVVLLVLVVTLTVSAANQNSRLTRLQHHGVRVSATVTGCTAYGSGIAQAVEAYICRGRYTLDGHGYESVIGGSRSLHPVGQVIPAVTIRGDPQLLSTATAVDKEHTSWTPYLTPIILAVVAVALAVGLVVWSRRHPRRETAPTG
jgi:hypothetical protein